MSRSILMRADDLVGHEDRPKAGIGEDLGFAELGHRDADGAGVELHPRDLRALGRLEMRPERDPGPFELSHHRGDVVFDRVEVEEEAGGVEVVGVHVADCAALRDCRLSDSPGSRSTLPRTSPVSTLVRGAWG